MKPLSPRIATAISNALGWLAANPERHIAGTLAVDLKGKPCLPNDPKAECFCVLGRISKELNLSGYPDADRQFEQEVCDASDYLFTSGRILGRNDEIDYTTIESRELVCDRLAPGNQQVIPWLAKGLNVPIADIAPTPLPLTIWQRIKGFLA